MNGKPRASSDSPVNMLQMFSEGKLMSVGKHSTEELCKLPLMKQLAVLI
jgi:hypothetical protein